MNSYLYYRTIESIICLLLGILFFTIYYFYDNYKKENKSKFYCFIMNIIDFRYWQCNMCHYKSPHGKIISADCKKHDEVKKMKNGCLIIMVIFSTICLYLCIDIRNDIVKIQKEHIELTNKIKVLIDALQVETNLPEMK